MTRPIERIEQDLVGLQEAVRAIAQELKTAYTSYLKVLGKTMRQQLILATYYLCTQGYPEKFLNLSLNQRQLLQQAIRYLGTQTAQQLLNYEQADTELVTEEIETEDDLEDDLEMDEMEADFYLLPFPEESKEPREFVRWQQSLEIFIQNKLKEASQEANQILYKSRLLPQEIPKNILDIANTVSEATTEIIPTIPNVPNILNMVIGLEDEEDSEEANLTQVIAISLRLGEIEFTDANLTSERKQIRHIVNRLHKITVEHQKIQREKSIAEAEAAWRSSWYED
ncbi:hypothetical protein IJ00_21915 [Calothrix sp. 336/3]|nr:hypothetical protein [Calothrix sp. 336/3]AKG24788.1 hypothetical protein IJ00_21915 [Calothrix sp. 336/3]